MKHISVYLKKYKKMKKPKKEIAPATKWLIIERTRRKKEREREERGMREVEPNVRLY